MKVLVTGGAGFIGSHIVDAYVQQQHDVVVVDNLSSGRREFVNPNARFLQLDVTSDDFTALMEAEAFDLVNHHAAHMELRVSVDKPVHDATVNVLGSVRLLEAARRTNVKHVVLASTSAVLGEQVVYPADETHPCDPISPYGVSKRSMELYARYYRKVFNMSISCLRYTTVYGPRQNPNGESGVVAIFLQRFLQGAQATIHGDGEQTRDYLHVDDVVRANLLAASHRVNGEFMIAAASEVSVNTLVTIIRDALQRSVHTVHGPAKAGDARRTLGSSSLFTSLTGWSPEITILDGIASTTKWFVANISATNH